MAVFGDLEDQLLEVFSTGREPDYAAARRLLDRGADINAVPLEKDEEERGRNLLSDFFLSSMDPQRGHFSSSGISQHEKSHLG